MGPPRRPPSARLDAAGSYRSCFAQGAGEGCGHVHGPGPAGKLGEGWGVHAGRTAASLSSPSPRSKRRGAGPTPPPPSPLCVPIMSLQRQRESTARSMMASASDDETAPMPKTWGALDEGTREAEKEVESCCCCCCCEHGLCRTWLAPSSRMARVARTCREAQDGGDGSRASSPPITPHVQADVALAEVLLDEGVNTRERRQRQQEVKWLRSARGAGQGRQYVAAPALVAPSLAAHGRRRRRRPARAAS